MDGASGAGGLVLLVGAFVNPLEAVLIELLTIVAQARAGGRVVVGATENLDHSKDGPFLSIQAIFLH